MAVDAAGPAPPRLLYTIGSILLLTAAVLAARHFATGAADGFIVNYRFDASTVRQRQELKSVVVNEKEDVRREVRDEGEKFMWPLLSDSVGAGNQLMEYISAAVVAHSLNRTLCLTPFQDGPAKHRGMLWQKGQGLTMEERYSMEQLGKFVPVASVDQCLRSCNHKVEDTWFLKGARRPYQSQFDQNTTDTIWSEGKDLNWSFVTWTSTEDIKKELGAYNQSCVALGGLFPGLRWRGAYLAASAYLTASHRIAHSASSIRNSVIGPDTKYLGVHWRFEESFCGGRELGSCFMRCGDGAIINTGLHPLAKEWINSSRSKCHFHGIRVTKEDVVGAIYDRAQERNLSTVYLATDGWIRGPAAANLVKEAVEMLREKNMTVVGLWRIEGLPNFPDGSFIPEGGSTELGKLFGLQDPDEVVNSRLIAGVEQELCKLAEVFLGSGQSTWSLAVFRSRLAQRRAREVLKLLTGDLSKDQIQQLDQNIHNQIIRELLSDEHEAGLLCGYHRYYEKFPVNATKETFEDEVPDGWLDLEACEMRIGHKGGKCEFATCTP